ncbi:MAG: SPOR domain-containing protein [Methylococcaceae bacterium]|nr:SPOR domain-containing protein [Methylococcaceae bacterium]
MADSTNLNSKIKLNQLDAELDTLLDEAELSITALDTYETEEDIIDKLLLDQDIDGSDLSAGMDDDFDLVDIETNAHSIGTGINPSVELDIHDNFPLDFLDTIALTPGINDKMFADPDKKEVTVVPLDTVEDEMPPLFDDTVEDEMPPLFDDTGLTEKLDDFSDFDEFNDFQDFQQPEIVEDGESDTDLSIEAVQHEIIEPIEMTSDINLKEIGLIDDVTELAAIDEAVEYDEFADDFDENNNIYSALPSTDSSIEESSQFHNEDVNNTQEPDNAISPDDFDITAGIDDDLINTLDQEDQLLQHSELADIPAETPTAGDVTNSSPELSPDIIAQLSESIGISSLMQFKSDQENFNKKNKKQMTDIETQAKKSSVMAYIALGFGVTSLITAVVMSVMFFRSKSEVAQLTGLVTTLHEDLSRITATNLAHHEQNLENTPIDPALVEKDMVLHGNPDIHSTEVKPDSASASNNASHETEHKEADQKEESKSLVSAAEKEHSSNESVKTESPAQTIVSHETENKPEEQHHNETSKSSEKIAVQADPSPLPIDTPKNQAPPKPEQSQIAHQKPLDEDIPKQALIEKKKVTTSTTKKAALKHKQNTAKVTTTATSDWSVNLIAYKQQWYANSKADEFKKKGIPVDIVPVTLNKVTWYRLRVGGFNDKNDASAYAGRVKKALNLNSVWVGNK